MNVILLIEGGPLDGQKFKSDLDHPPPRMIGSDIHRDLFGTYERKGQMTIKANNDGSPGEINVVYRLRSDDDFWRIAKVMTRFKARLK